MMVTWVNLRGKGVGGTGAVRVRWGGGHRGVRVRWGGARPVTVREAVVPPEEVKRGREGDSDRQTEKGTLSPIT